MTLSTYWRHALAVAAGLLLTYLPQIASGHFGVLSTWAHYILGVIAALTALGLLHLNPSPAKTEAAP